METDSATQIPPFLIKTYKIRNRKGSAPAPHKDQRSKIPGNAKTLVEVGFIGAAPVTESRTQELWSVEPRTAPNHPAAAIATVFFQPGRTVSQCIAIIVMPAILRPFPNVTQHIEQPKMIFGITRHRCGIHMTIGAFRQHPIGTGNGFCFLPGAIGVIALLIVPVIARCRCACPCRVFPFRFRWQAVSCAGAARQPGRIRLRVVPRHAHHRMIGVLFETGIFPITFR